MLVLALDGRDNLLGGPSHPADQVRVEQLLRAETHVQQRLVIQLPTARGEPSIHTHRLRLAAETPLVIVHADRQT